MCLAAAEKHVIGTWHFNVILKAETEKCRPELVITADVVKQHSEINTF